VITGAAGDLGQALCDSFIADEFAVYAADVKKPAQKAGLNSIKVDVTRRQQVFALAERAAKENDLMVWINCAGIFLGANVAEASDEMWHQIIAVNLSGTFYGCAAALSAMRRNVSGRIVNVGSISGQIGGVGVHPAYGASKAGVHALTKTYALEGSRHGIYCNAVAPGLLEGEMMYQLSEAQRESVIQASPQKRLGQIDEVVHAIRYLADDRAGYVNGVILPVNGGAYMPS